MTHLNPPRRLALYDELLRRFASGTRAAQLYAADHPLLGRNVEGLLGALKTLQQQQPSITVGIVDNEFVVADTPLPKASAGMKDLIDRLLANKVERISFERGVTPEEVVGLMLGVAKLPTKGGGPEPSLAFPAHPPGPHHVGGAGPRRHRQRHGRHPAALHERRVRRGDRVGERRASKASPTSRRRCTPSRVWPTP